MYPMYSIQNYQYQVHDELKHLISEGENLLQQIMSILSMNQIQTGTLPNFGYPITYSIDKKKVSQNRKKIKDLIQSVMIKNPVHTEIKIWENKITEFCSRHSINFKNLTNVGNSFKLLQKFNYPKLIQTSTIRMEQFIRCLKECEKLDLVPNYLLPKILISNDTQQVDLTKTKTRFTKKFKKVITSKKVNKNTKISKAKNNSIFISYTHESEDHKKWVKKISDKLTAQGFNVYLDQYIIDLGSNLQYFMEISIKKSKFVLIICTPTYQKKAIKREGGVGAEYNLIVSEKMFTQNKIKSNFICILRKGTKYSAIPLYFQSNLYKDFKIDTDFSKNMKDLVRRLKEQPRK